MKKEMKEVNYKVGAKVKELIAVLEKSEFKWTHFVDKAFEPKCDLVILDKLLVKSIFSLDPPFLLLLLLNRGLSNRGLIWDF